MLAFLSTVNKLLDIKLVQWLLLGLCSCLFLVLIIFTFKHNSLRLQHALLESSYSKVSGAVDIQNTQIARLGEEYKLKEEALKQASDRASKIAVASQSNLKRALEADFRGESCSEKVKHVFNIISTSRVR